MDILHQDSLSLFDGKICPRCALWKPFAEYSKATKRSDGLQYHCKACNKQQRQPFRRTELRSCHWCHLPYMQTRWSTARFCGTQCYAEWRSTLRRPIADRFWEKVQKTDNCWLWTGRINNKGYGEISDPERNHYVFAHRLSYEWVNGPIPDGMDICHACDCPRCVNPAHLFVGTRAINMADAVAKGRVSHGSTHTTSKLTEDLVIEIRSRAAAGETQPQLAAAFGVSRSNIGLIVHRKTWKHI